MYQNLENSIEYSLQAIVLRTNQRTDNSDFICSLGLYLTLHATADIKQPIIISRILKEFGRGIHSWKPPLL